MSDLPVFLPESTPARVLATGAFLKNRACLIDGERVLWSPMHGELDNPQACLALDHSVDQLCRQAVEMPVAIAHDLHPDFYSSGLATRTAIDLGVSSTAVQHHHAHIAATIAQCGLTCPVIGIALDGFGLGLDDSAWGGELLWVNGGRMAHQWRRLAHLQPLRMPGGDRAALEPWRLAAALLHKLGRGTVIEERFAPLVGRQATRIVLSMLEKSINCPSTSSAGRWFDLAAAALGLCTRQCHEGEAAKELELHAYRYLQQYPDINELVKLTDNATQRTSQTESGHSLDLQYIVAPFLDIDKDDSSAVERAAAVFHVALVNMLARAATLAAFNQNIHDVVLGGGCLVNQILRRRLTEVLQDAGLRVHVPAESVCGDTALALGQAWVAACSLETN